MQPIVNVSTKKPEPMRDDQISDAILAGTHSYPAGSMVEMRDHENNPVEIPAENVQRAIQMGFRPYGAVEAATDEYVRENDNVAGALKVGVGQFADEFLGGVPELILDHTQDDLARAKREGLKNNFPLINDVSGVTGAIAGMAIPGAPMARLGKGASLAAKAAEAGIAARLGVAAGEEVGKRTITNAAKQIAAKIAAKAGGGAVEGAIISAPHALTEASLGDPELAAESLVWGGGLGALMGGSAGAAGELMGLTGKAAKKGYEWLGGKELNAGNMKTKLLELGFSVPEEDIVKYMQNRQRIVASESRTAFHIKDDIDGLVGKRLSDEAEAKTEWMKAADELDTHYKSKIDELRSERPSVELAQSITDDLNDAKASLGSQSEMAEEALAASDVLWDKATIKRRFTNAYSKHIGKEVGELKKDAAEKLRGLIADIDANYGKKLNGSEMREIVRTLRKENEALFNMEAGQFSEYFERSLAEISEGMQKNIKSKVPEYEAIMNEMAPLSKSLREMRKKFGTVEKSMNSLRQLAGGQKEELMDKALAEYSTLRGKPFLESVQGFRDNKRLLSQARLEDLKPRLLPNLHAAEQDARGRFESIASGNDPIRSLTPGRTQGLMGVSAENVRKTEMARAIDALSQMEGKTAGLDDFLTQIDDRRILDGFDRARINGSRRVNWMGALATAATGGILGGPVGAAIGATAGAVLDINGGNILKKLLDGETFLGPLFLEKQMGNGGRKLDRLGEVLGKMKGRATNGGRLTPSPVDGARLRAIQAMVDHLVEPDKKNDRHEVNTRVNERFSEWVSNPDALIDDIQSVSSQVGETGAPEISGIAATKLVTAVTYLNDSLPKPPRAPNPFAPKVRWKPSSFQLKSFEEKFEAVADPFSIIDHLENGSLTKNHMEAIQAVYPALHETIQQRVYNAVANGDVELGYTDRLKLSLVLGVPLDESMQNIARHQQTFAGDPTGSQSADGPGSGPAAVGTMSISHQYTPEKF